MVGNSCHSYDVLFRSFLGNSRCRAVNSISKATIYFNVNRMTQSVTSTEPPQCVDPLSYLVRAAAGGQTKSCFDFAENRAANSLWVGDHRYTRIKFASKLIWV